MIVHFQTQSHAMKNTRLETWNEDINNEYEAAMSDRDQRERERDKEVKMVSKVGAIGQSQS